MARTKSTGDAQPQFVPTAGGGMIMKFCEEREVRIENRKLIVPVRLTGEESAEDKAISFYTCAGKLDAEAAHISANGRATYLADHGLASGLLPLVKEDLMACYREQLGDPSKWTIKSFHDPTGAVIANTVTTLTLKS